MPNVPVDPELPGITVDDEEFLHADFAVKRNLFVRFITRSLHFDQKIQTTHPVGVAIDRPGTAQGSDHIGRSKSTFPTEPAIADIYSWLYLTTPFQCDHIAQN